MINSKKMLVLCTTTLISFTALGTFPNAAMADTSGNTTITYNETTKPADWSLSVTPSVKLDQDFASTNDMSVPTNFKGGDAMVSILTADGSAAFEDSTKVRSFSVKGVSNTLVGSTMQMAGEGDTKTDLYAATFPQGALATTPTRMSKKLGMISDIQLTSKTTGASNMFRLIRFAVDRNSSTFDATKSYTNTISWTATEK